MRQGKRFCFGPDKKKDGRLDKWTDRRLNRQQDGHGLAAILMKTMCPHSYLFSNVSFFALSTLCFDLNCLHSLDVAVETLKVASVKGFCFCFLFLLVIHWVFILII